MRMFLLIVLSACVCSANGPAWISDLSSSEQIGTQAVTVWVPAPGYVTVGVHNTYERAVAKPPAGVTAESFIVMLEARTVFLGFPEERKEGIPFYMPTRKWHEPTGEWAVRLHVTEPGTYEVPIRCDSDTVTVTLKAIAGIPASDCAFGFFTDYSRYSYREHERLYFEQMRDHGCNTFTCYAWSLPRGQDIVRQMQTALDMGLCDIRFPMFILSGCGGAVGEAPDAAKQLLGEQPLPEFILYNQDEPAIEKAKDVRAYTVAHHAAGYRSGTAVSLKAAFGLGQFLDIWLVHMDGCSQVVKRHAVRKGAEFWVYTFLFRGTNAPLHRYYTGLWTFTVRPKGNMLWAYMHDAKSKIELDGTWNALRVCEHALGTPDGPMDTVGLEGFRDGTYDYRVLRALEETILRNPRHPIAPEAANWLQSLVDQVDWSFWPNGQKPEYAPYAWDIPDTAKPPIADMGAMREQALQYVEVLRNAD